MSKVLRKLDSGEELKGFELDAEIKTTTSMEGKALGDYEIEIIGSSARTDRDGESLDPKGVDLKDFKKNPVILPQHDYRKPAIGKATNIKVKDGQLIFKIEFPEEGINPEADVYRKLYKTGFMSASSVGFIPKAWKDSDKEPYRTYTKWGLLELSLVSVPSNADALTTQRSTQEAVTKGIITADEAKSIGLELPEVEEIEETVEEEIEDVETKGNDPGYAYSEEHKMEHEGIEVFMQQVDVRLARIEGFLEGLQKDNEGEIKETVSYITKLLSVGSADRTESQTEKNSDVDIVKNIFNKKKEQ